MDQAAARSLREQSRSRRSPQAGEVTKTKVKALQITSRNNLKVGITNGLSVANSPMRSLMSAKSAW
jgi:hypothetical protein